MAHPEKKALVLLTSCARAYDGEPTGWCLLTAAHPWAELVKAGYRVDIASLTGGAAPMDPAGLVLHAGKDGDATAFLADAAVAAALAATRDVHSLALRDYALVFVAGGHGAMMDLARDDGLAAALTRYLRDGGAVGAVCHGVAALLRVKGRDGAAPVVRGEAVTCCTNAEEEQSQEKEQAPFLLENQLRALGGSFTCAGPFAQHVSVAPAARIVTGQVGAHTRTHQPPHMQRVGALTFTGPGEARRSPRHGRGPPRTCRHVSALHTDTHTHNPPPPLPLPPSRARTTLAERQLGAPCRTRADRAGGGPAHCRRVARLARGRGGRAQAAARARRPARPLHGRRRCARRGRRHHAAPCAAGAVGGRQVVAATRA